MSRERSLESGIEAVEHCKTEKENVQGSLLFADVSYCIQTSSKGPSAYPMAELGLSMLQNPLHPGLCFKDVLGCYCRQMEVFGEPGNRNSLCLSAKLRRI